MLSEILDFIKENIPIFGIVIGIVFLCALILCTLILSIEALVHGKIILAVVSAIIFLVLLSIGISLIIIADVDF